MLVGVLLGCRKLRVIGNLCRLRLDLIEQFIKQELHGIQFGIGNIQFGCKRSRSSGSPL